MTKPDLTKLLTIYGRKPVLEALEDHSLQLFRLHLAESNKTADIIRDIIRIAKSRNIDIQTHDKLALSRISKNSQQDQGVALDIHMPGFMTDTDFLQEHREKNFQLIALDGITNPQNLGMIIRSVCASPLTGLLLPAKGCAKLDALVIKASAGTLFKCKILKCENLTTTLQTMKKMNTAICLLDRRGAVSLFDYRPTGSVVYVLGNETSGISADIEKTATHKLNIPMNHDVESLNVAVTAALVAFSAKLP
jgi:23S rRNA (guanosine2251-2'-O)-methyltransferase